MALALDGTPSNVVNTGSVTSTTLTLSSSFGKGLVGIHFIINGTTISSITGGGLTFTKMTGSGQLGAGVGNSCEIWTAPVGSSALSSTVFTINFTGTATYSVGCAYCFSNGGTGSIAFDGSATTNSGTNVTSAITTAQPNTMVIGYTRYTSTTAPGLGSGWSSLMSSVANSYSMHEYLPEATAGTYTPPVSAADCNSAITFAIYVSAAAPAFIPYNPWPQAGPLLAQKRKQIGWTPFFDPRRRIQRPSRDLLLPNRQLIVPRKVA